MQITDYWSGKPIQHIPKVYSNDSKSKNVYYSTLWITVHWPGKPIYPSPTKSLLQWQSKPKFIAMQITDYWSGKPMPMFRQRGEQKGDKPGIENSAKNDNIEKVL